MGDGLDESPAFRAIASHLKLINAAIKTQDEMDKAVNCVGFASLRALDEGRIAFKTKNDRELIQMALALLLAASQQPNSSTLH